MSAVHKIDTSTEAVDAMATDLYDRVYIPHALLLRALAAERDALRTAIYRAWRASGHRLACRTESELYLNETLEAARNELLAVYPIDDLHTRSSAENAIERQMKDAAKVAP